MKKLLALAMTLIMATGLIGCGSNSDTSEGEIAITDATEETDNNSNEIEIQHVLGTTTVPKNPKKIAVFDFAVLDTIDTLGIEVEMAAPTENLPSYLSAYETVTYAGGIKEPDIEELFKFEPEIIFIGGRQSSFYDELSQIAPTVYLPLEADTYLLDVFDNTNIICEIFGLDADAPELTKIFDKAAEISEKAIASDETALILLLNDGSISTFGRGSRFGMVFDVLNVKPADENIEPSTHGDGVSYEYIAEVNPDIIFVIDRNDIVGGESEGIEALNNELVNGTNAAKAGKIIALDSEIWYLAGGGLSSVYTMLEEIDSAFN